MVNFEAIIIGQITISFLNTILGFTLLKNNKEFKLEIKYILSFCALDFITTLYQLFLLNTDPPHESYYLVTLAFELGEIILLPAYIGTIISNKPNWPTILLFSFLAIGVTFLYHDKYESLIQVATTILITVYCFRYLIWIFNSQGLVNITQTKHFWIIMGVMICYTSSLPSSLAGLILTVFGMDVYFSSFIITLSILYLLLNIIMHLFFIKSFQWKETSHTY